MKGILDLNETPSKAFDWNENFAYDTKELSRNLNLSKDEDDELMVGDEDFEMENLEEEKQPNDNYDLVKKLSGYSGASSNLQKKMNLNNGYQLQPKANHYIMQKNDFGASVDDQI